MTTHGLDALAIGAHPDDVELTVGGTLLTIAAKGGRIGVCHLTAGEMGTRGTPETRREEAEAAAAVLGADAMEILGLPDGRLDESVDAKDLVIRAIRRHRPRLLLAPLTEDLHPDHAAAGRLVKACAFLSGLARWDTGQEPWRPEGVLHYMSHDALQPTMIVDVSAVFETKREAARCYRSQFHDPRSKEPATYISGPDFWHGWEGRAAYWGHFIGVRWGEPLKAAGPVPTRDPVGLFTGFGKYRNT